MTYLYIIATCSNLSYFPGILLTDAEAPTKLQTSDQSESTSVFPQGVLVLNRFKAEHGRLVPASSIS